MRGDLVKKEPNRLAAWEKGNLYERIIKRRQSQDAPRFILHDGPPFANGDVHMGTALNKVLKDLVVKSKTMAGYEVPLIPGWDCHGLPIEFKVMQDARDEEPAEIRRRCEEFAKGFIDIQRDSFRRLGVFADWKNPYLTLDPSYEADIIRVFATLVEQGAVYQSQKPVQWSYGAQTALAEAEVEYMDKKSSAIYVSFQLEGAKEALDGASMVVWTTTPWTLPANLGIAVHPDFDYVVGDFSNGEVTKKLVIAKELLEAFAEKTAFKPSGELSELRGKDLEGLQAKHPFLDRQSKLITALFVTTETGTGAVHIAPGHGADDYVAGMQNNLGLLSPVDNEGKFTDECGLPDLVGTHVFKANKSIVALLSEQGDLLGEEVYEHSYPHCWRSKTPIIFRAVEQFFISLDGLREKALNEIDQVEWLPKWGRNRIYGTVESRPDWCISRQRTWGVPLPVFFDGGKAVLDADVARKVADLVEKEGTNVWFALSNEELTAKLGLPSHYQKGRDTLDVWIDSGSSHVAVMDRHPELSAPADLYLEATDQHRGWFQSSLLLSTAVRGTAPYKAVLTHGFVVDQDTGKKTSKSDAKKSGKPTDAAHFYNQYGADIVRLWVSSVDWQSEVPFGEDLFKQIAEPYRRLRNTLRILLGNINGFDPQQDLVEPSEMTLIDRWILERLHVLTKECLAAYEAYEFRKVFSAVNQFCANDLSALYVDMTKDRMYCDSEKGVRRRATQTAMWQVFDSLSKLLAPILAFTTEEAREHAGLEGSIHEQDFPKPDPVYEGGEASEKVKALLQLRAQIQTAIEAQVQAKAFQKNNEALVILTLPQGDPLRELLADQELAKEFLIISELQLEEGSELKVAVQKSAHVMCPRCRRYEPLVTELCERCDSALPKA